ncbi:MAG: hypothetical protein A4E19_12895 [Nitrospira sp. SG-bin1]|nr:MAG: hypothetical protein A4E19_12895 [Nitrospira sp. SG-bin1]
MYCEDLAYIHDRGYSDGAARAATWIVHMLRTKHRSGGRLLDLGCVGATAVFSRAGYETLGMDISRSMVHLARRRVPHGKSRVASFLLIRPFHGPPSWRPARSSITLPSADVGFAFDVRMPPRKDDPLTWVTGKIGTDWSVMSGRVVDMNRRILIRSITTLRLVRGRWRRGQEIHRQRLYRPSDIRAWLRVAGFHIERRSGYDEIPLSTGALFIASKPGAP